MRSDAAHAPELFESFEQAYRDRVVRNEERYATFFAIFLTAVVALIAGSGVLTRIYERPNPAPLLLVLVCACIGVLWVLRLRARRARSTGGELPRWLQFVEVTLIASFLTTALWVEGAGFAYPYYTLFGPHAMFAAVWVVLTGLRMVPWISVAAGSLTALGYGTTSVLMYANISEGPLPEPFHELTPQLVRAALLVALGVLAAALNSQLRRGAIGALTAAEERNRLFRTLGRNVSPAVAEELVRLGDRPGNQTRFVVVMFLDIRGFTTFAESRDAEEVVRALESMFDFMVAAVERTGGVVNKFLGDGFMAVWGAPIAHGEAADCQAAVTAGQAILRELRAAVERGAVPPLEVGIGLHCGRAVAGSVGAQSRSEYTIIGDVVNVASRVEGMNRALGSKLLVTAPLWQRLESPPEAVIHDGVEVKGRREPLRLYQLE